MKLQRLLGALIAAAAAASCNAVLGIEEGDPRPPPDPSPSFCEGKPEGTPLPEQTIGDCVVVACDGYGKSRVVQSELDVDDGNPCTQDQCMGSTASHAPLSDVPCYAGPAGTEGIGICKVGIQQCNPPGNPVGECQGEVLPEPERCSTLGVDDDCDGLEDEEGGDCTCSDGIVSKDIGEQCDDGGNADGDPCSSSCKEQRVLELSLGQTVTCARLNAGRLKCWGNNEYGQLGLGDNHSRGYLSDEMGSGLPLVDLGTDRIVTSVKTSYATCALLSDGKIKCWGLNTSGQLGLGDTQNRGDEPGEMGDSLPTVDLGEGKTAKAIALGTAHACALLSDGKIKCWGLNDHGQLGLEDTENRGDDLGEMGDNLPTLNFGQAKVATAIAASGSHTCALLSDGKIKCWGANVSGQLGLEDMQSRGDNPGEMGSALPTVKLGENAKAIAAGGDHTCALLSGGSVKCWGYNSLGALGLGDTQNRGDGPDEMGFNLPAVDLGAGKQAQAIAAGDDRTCVLLSDDSVKCWGRNAAGGLGLGDTQNRGDGPGEMGDALPSVNLGNGRTPKAVTAGSFHNCVLLTDDAVKCWGGNFHGALGLGDSAHRGDDPADMGDALPTVKLFSDSW